MRRRPDRNVGALGLQSGLHGRVAYAWIFRHGIAPTSIVAVTPGSTPHYWRAAQATGEARTTNKDGCRLAFGHLGEYRPGKVQKLQPTHISPKKLHCGEVSSECFGNRPYDGAEAQSQASAHRMVSCRNNFSSAASLVELTVEGLFENLYRSLKTGGRKLHAPPLRPMASSFPVIPTDAL